MSKSMFRFMHRSAVSICTLTALVAGSVESIAVPPSTSPAGSSAKPAPGKILPAKASAPSSQFYSYQKDGESYFAISLQPAAKVVEPAVANDIVVLFDTSASQTGSYREKAFEVLRATLATLGDQDRVHLYSVDIAAVPMTSTFVPARGVEIDAALAKLAKRAPLGSTDIPAVIEAAVNSYGPAKEGTSVGPRTALYIGDGVNNAGVNGEELRKSFDQARAARVSVNSYAIGPQVNAELLAALANQTGGMLVVNADAFGAQDAGSMLSRVVREPVIWSAQGKSAANKMPASLAKVYPVNMPPLRTDRDTILIGEGSVDQPFVVEVQGEVAGKTIPLKWNVEPQPSDDENAYLATLAKSAETDGGYGLPTVGTAGLQEVRRLVNLGSRNLTQLGQQAVAAGNAVQAKRLLDEAVRLDPNNQQAADLHAAVHSGNISEVRKASVAVADRVAPETAAASAPVAKSGDLRMVRQPPPAAEFPAAERAIGDGRLVDDVTSQRRLIEQVISQEVQAELDRARNRMATDPKTVEQDLKRLLDRVENTPEVRANVRAELRNRLTFTIREASLRADEFETRQIELMERSRASEEARLLNERLMARELKVQALIERYNALLAEGRYQDAERDAARVAFELMPNSAVTSNAVIVGRTIGFTNESARFRDMHQKAVVDVLAMVDQANIPFPDDPPIVYPDADWWIQMTREREKYKAVDLSRAGSSEEKINKALLRSDVPIELPPMSLKDATEWLSDKFEIPIKIDDKALIDDAQNSEVEVTLEVSGVTLRSALRHLLRPASLTYTIRDEVLMITTTTAAEAKMRTKVYPVADLVLPITNGGGVNPFMMGGMGGGMGGGMFNL
ncbi:MAG: VWA domain-containing protein, partial [Planctomycetota bacterium]|nr:VWA domain-containing protein [Planctomycetota bacterium]